MMAVVYAFAIIGATVVAIVLGLLGYMLSSDDDRCPDCGTTPHKPGCKYPLGK